MNIALAFVRRDFLIWSSYRLAVVWQLLGVCLLVGLVYFVGVTLGDRTDLLGGGSTSFVAFVLSGIAVTDLVMQGLHSVPQAIRENQKAGTLEPMLLAPLGGLGLLLASSLFSLALALARAAAYFVLGWSVLGFWHQANLATVALVLVPGVVAFLALGTLSAAFVIVVKQGDPIVIAYAALTAMLSGVFFPVTVLPAWLQPFAAYVPLTYVLAGVRAGLDGAAPFDVIGTALLLAGLGAVLLALGLVGCNWALNYAKTEGSLAQY
jgi:ABC-2 type transport system permease protein